MPLSAIRESIKCENWGGTIFSVSVIDDKIVANCGRLRIRPTKNDDSGFTNICLSTMSNDKVISPMIWSAMPTKAKV